MTSLPKDIPRADQPAGVERAGIDPQHPLYFVWAQAPVGMAIVGADGSIEAANPALCEMLGYSPEELRALHWQDFTHPEDVQLDRSGDRLVETGRDRHYEMTRRYLRKDGSVIHVQVRVTTMPDEDGQPTRLLGVAQDVTEHVLARQRLAHAALHDTLTGLPNRRWFVDALQRQLVLRPQDDIAVLFVDLDHFKTVNDSIGHHLGDRFLISAGQRIRRCLPEGVSLARYGGDEFTVLVPGPDAARRGRGVAVGIHMALHEPLALGERDVYCTVSVGLAVAGPGERDANRVMRNADIALYRAKDQGRARTVEFTRSMAVEVHQAHLLQTELRQAASHRQLRLHYQPIVDLDSRLAIGFEALLRWRHPTRGLLSPEAFLDQAEESGLGPRIAHWAIPEACRAALALAQGNKRGPYVSVNLSMRQLADPQLLEVIDRALDESGLPGKRLRIEVTESVVAHDVEEIVDVLDAMRDRGLRIYMDDFGTGVSSYARLHRLPLDALKIDRAFVAAMDSTDGRSLVRSILTLSSSLGLPAIAEGVETEQQRADLLDLGCLWSQGFLFGAPMPLDQATLVPCLR